MTYCIWVIYDGYWKFRSYILCSEVVLSHPFQTKTTTGFQTCDYFEVRLVGRRYICITESHQSKDFTSIGGFWKTPFRSNQSLWTQSNDPNTAYFLKFMMTRTMNPWGVTWRIISLWKSFRFRNLTWGTLFIQHEYDHDPRKLETAYTKKKGKKRKQHEALCGSSLIMFFDLKSTYHVQARDAFGRFKWPFSRVPSELHLGNHFRSQM